MSHVPSQVQDAIGVPADAQQLIFSGKILRGSETVAGCGIKPESTVQMAVGKRRAPEATMSPGGTWH